MRIKQLEIKGFKSFKNRTIIRFGKATNCIVGPNGCGKSNLIDAFLWVMGETSPKHLRGSSMEDLIFAGTNKHSPSGMAEVSLVMELAQQKTSAKIPDSPSTSKNTNTFKPRFPSPYENCSEIMLTRLLDRDGKSEYLINSKPCRLRDIQEIFMDTGAGTHGFSFIEQGAVEQFILSKPEQKYQFIESAAGISKFRHRKKSAERKLELTETNLKRLKDILFQQKTQMEKLKKQSEKAEQFKKLKEQIREKDILIHYWDLKHLQKEKQHLDEQIRNEHKKTKDTKTQLEKKTVLVKKLQEAYQSNKTQADKMKTDLQLVKAQFLSLEKEIAGLSASIQVNKQYLPSQNPQPYKKNQQSLLTKREDSTVVITQLEKKQKELYEKWEWLKKEHEVSIKKLSDLKAKKQSLETELVNHAHQEALCQERDLSILNKIKNWDYNKQEWQNLLEQKNKSVQKLQTQKNHLMEKLENKKQLSFNITDSVQALEKNVNSFKQNIQNQESQLKKAQEEAIAVYSEWDSLKKIEHRMMARETGIQSVLQSTEEKEHFVETSSAVRLLSPVLEKAVASYLELRLKSVFCANENLALSALNTLNQKKQGRCRFIIKNLTAKEKTESNSTDEESKKLETEPGFQFLLKTHVDGNKELIDLLFDRTAVATDMQNALQLKKKYPAWCFLTLKGEVLTPAGDLIGGEFPNKEMNILSFRRAIKDLPVQYEDKKIQVELISARLKKTKTLFQKSVNKLSELNKEEGAFQISILEMNKDLESVNRDQDHLTSEISRLRKKILECQTEQMELQKQRACLKNESSPSIKRDTTNTELKKTVSECEEAKKEMQILLGQKDQLWLQLADCEKKLAAMKEKNLLLKQALESGQEEEKDLMSFFLKKKSLIQINEKQLQEKQEKKKNLYQKITLKESQTTAFIEEQEKTGERISGEQSAVVDLHQVLTENESSINNLKLQSESLLLKKSALTDRVTEKYQVDLYSLKEQDSLHPADEKKANSPFRTFSEQLSDFDKNREENILQKLNKQLSRIGEVNLLALKEYEETVRENEFYQKQYEDLCISKEKLSQVIKRIDRFCSKKFKEVFEEVNSCFSKVWPSLFEGGQAKLILTKNLEKNMEGMDIMVQPPGKKVQSMSLLSGGEKAMTAVAVIFSIFLVKPSPFCILDEVDAPLDDINVVRFNSLLAEMAKVSQVIIITHNKYTMRECDQLYGVTMEEKGVSKVISMNMKPIHTRQLNHSPTPVS